MGLAASQARYLFISTRMNDLEAGMMRLSAQQLRLSDQANDIEERRDYEANLMHLEFNGERYFTYDDMMGEAAMNNGEFYFLTTNDGNNRVVLNQKYTNAIKAAGIAEEGGEATQDALVNFMGSAAGTPKSANDWKEVITGKLSNTDAYKPIDNFKQTYGVCPQQGTDSSKPITHEETYYTYEYQSSDDFAKTLSGNANLNATKSTKSGINGMIENAFVINSENRNDAGFINNKDNITWSQIMSGQNTVLYLGNHKTSHYNEGNVSITVCNIIDNLGAKVKSAGYSSSAVDTAVNNTKSQYKDKYTKTDGSASSAKNYNSITKHQTRGASSGHHSKNEYSIDLKNMFNYFYTQLKAAMGTAKEGGKGVKAVENKKTVIDGYEPIRNQQGKTYEEWHAAWDKVVADNKLDETKADEYRRTGYIEVEVSDEDKQTLNNYKQIFLKACSQGWKQDNDLDNTANLTSKLENMQYKVNGEVIKNLKNNFQTVKTNDQELVNQRYDSELRDIKRQEKVIETQQTAMQTELSALQTEQSSVESIIDKNVQRGFNLFA